MNKTRTDALIRDLFSLYSRYGRAEFETAIKSIESGIELRVLSSLMRAAQNSLGSNISRAPKKISSQKTKSPKQRLDEFLADLVHRDEEASLVARFISDVADRKLLPSAALLRDFARELGVTLDAKMDRRVIARRIGEKLLDKAVSQRQEYMALAEQIGAEKSTLQAWSDVIVKDRN